MPNPTVHNADLQTHAAAITKLADNNGLAHLSLLELVKPSVPQDKRLTMNSLHFNDAGHRALAKDFLEKLGFEIYDDLLLADNENGERIILEGLEEFREHLGGQLTITLIQGIGEGIEVNVMDRTEVLASVDELRKRHLASPLA